MPLPPTPWIRAYDNPELYLGGYRSGLEQQQIRQRGALAAAELGQRSQEMAGRMQMAQMEEQTRREALMHREAIEAEQMAMQKRLDESKLSEAARRAAAELSIQAEYKRTGDYLGAVMKYGPEAGFGTEGIAAMMRAKESLSPTKLETMEEGGQKFFRSRPTAEWQAFPRAAATQAKLPPEIAGSAATLDKAEAEAWNAYIAAGDNESKKKIAMDTITEIRKQKRALLPSAQGAKKTGPSYQLVDGKYILVPGSEDEGSSPLLEGAGLGYSPNIYGGGQMMRGPSAYLPPGLMPQEEQPAPAAPTFGVGPGFGVPVR